MAKKIELGLIVGIGRDPNESLKQVAEIGVPTCQMAGTAEAMLAGKYPEPEDIRKAASKAGI